MIRDTDLSSSQLSRALSSRQPASVLWIKWDFDEEWGLLLNALYFFLLSTSSWMSKPTFQVSYSVVGLLEITTASACHVWDLILLSTGPKTMMSVGDDAKVMVKASSGNTVPQLFTRPHRHHYLFSRLSPSLMEPFCSTSAADIVFCCSDACCILSPLSTITVIWDCTWIWMCRGRRRGILYVRWHPTDVEVVIVW